MSSMRTTSGWMPTAANHAGCASHPRAASAARTASGVCAASAVTFIMGAGSWGWGVLGCPQGVDDVQARGPDRREEAADDAHHQREHEGAPDDAGRQRESEPDLREAPEVERRDAGEGEQRGEPDSRSAAGDG